MRFILGLILVGVLAYFSPILLPWWGIAPLAALVGFAVGAKWWQSLIFGLIATSLVWGIQTYMMDQANESILSSKMAQVFQVGSGMALILITTLLGGLLGGMGAMSGSLLRDGILPKKEKVRRSPNVSRNKKRRRGWR